MNQSVGAFIEWVELMTFFPGYLFVFAMVYLLTGRQQANGMFQKKIITRLPIAYALVATLYWGFLLKSWYPGYDLASIRASIYHPVLRVCGMMGILCWIPYIYKRPLFSLFHSLVFFVLLLKDMLIPAPGKTLDDISRKNDLRIYGASIALNLGALLVITILTIIFSRFKKKD